MASSEWIDTSGSLPVLKPAATVTGVLATVLYGWYAGLLGFLDRGFSGLWGTVETIRRFLADPGGVIPRLFDAMVLMMEQAAIQNAQYLQSFGTWGIIVGFIEGMVVVYIIVIGLQYITRRASEVFL